MRSFLFLHPASWILHLFLLTAHCSLLTSPAFSQEKKIDVTFGRVVVEARGVAGERIRAYVDLYDSDEQKVSGGKSEQEGETFFHVREGVYRAVVFAANSVEVPSIRVLPGQETRVRTEWGKLTLSFKDPGKFATFSDSRGGQVLSQAIGKTGKLSCYVKPGAYHIQVQAEPRKEFPNLKVEAGKETVAGELLNHPPRIVEISSDPPIVGPGQSAKIRVEATDEDEDPLTYTYKPSVGRIEGKGDRVVFHAPQGKGPYRVTVAVTDPQGASDTFAYHISAGDLLVSAAGPKQEPVNAHVQVFDGLGNIVQNSMLGPTGARTFRLREGQYKVLVAADNVIEVEDLQVLTDQKRKLELLFGRVVVESFGANGERVDTSVDLFAADGEKAGTGKEKPGETSFTVREGLYRASIFAGNYCEIPFIRVERGKETRVRTDWGKLTLRLDEPGKYAYVYDSQGRKILGEAIGKGGRLSCNVQPGTYSVEVFTEPRKEFRNLVVQAGRETLAGDFLNHPPRIQEVWSDPPLVKPGETARLRVDATDDDGDPLTYTYKTSVGRIEGQGPKVTYFAPKDAATYKVTVTATDTHGDSDTFDYYLSPGELIVRAVTGRGAPVNGYVHVYDTLGARVAAENLGPGGTKSWQLREGVYRVQVFADTMIEVPDVEVRTGQRKRVDVPFGRVVVDSRGVEGEQVDCSVELLDEENQKAGEGKGRKDGKTFFDVAEGSYRAVLTGRSRMEIRDIRVVAGREIPVRADWGKLTLSVNAPRALAVFYDSEGKKIMGEPLGQVGRLSCHVPPGMYRIEVYTEPKREFRNLLVQPNQETLAGDFVNQPPRIVNITSDPPLIKAGQTAKIRVDAVDDDGDLINYNFVANSGRVEGKGDEAVYYAPQDKGPYFVTIWVSDQHEDSFAYAYYISGGDLTVSTFTGHGEPVDAVVHVYNELGARVETGSVGPEGSRTWRLQEGKYKLEIFSDNRIEVPEVNVVTDLDAYAVVNFGKLTVECFGTDRKPLNTYVQVRGDGAEKVAGGSTGDDGTIAFNLRPGLYDIVAHQSNEISKPRVQVDSQQAYFVSLDPSSVDMVSWSARKPAIEQIVVKPLRSAGTRTFEVAVSAYRPSGGMMSYGYECEGGTVEGSGSKVTVKGAGGGEIKVRVAVRSETGEETKGEVLIPAVRKTEGERKLRN